MVGGGGGRAMGSRVTLPFEQACEGIGVVSFATHARVGLQGGANAALEVALGADADLGGEFLGEHYPVVSPRFHVL